MGHECIHYLFPRLAADLARLQRVRFDATRLQPAAIYALDYDRIHARHCNVRIHLDPHAPAAPGRKTRADVSLDDPPVAPDAAHHYFLRLGAGTRSPDAPHVRTVYAVLGYAEI